LHVAFSRWHIERCFQDEKGLLGLDHFECRRYRAIQRHLIVTVISHLFLARMRMKQIDATGEKKSDTSAATPSDACVHSSEEPAPLCAERTVEVCG